MQESELASQTLIFLHIPKAAGTSFKRILEKNFRQEQVYLVDGPEDEDKLEALSDREKLELRLIYGHQYFGLHRFLPQRATYMTILRDPIARTISHYRFVRRVRHHPLHERASRVTLEEYVSQRIAGKELNNGQTRRISGIIDDVECDQAMLDLAKANLEQHFSVVGVSERFDEMLMVAKQRFHWGNIYYRRYNRTGGSRLELPERVTALIEERNQFDFQLYEYANHLLDRQWREQPRALHQSMRIFKAMNFFYGLPYEIQLFAFFRIPGVRYVRDKVRKKSSG